MGQGILIKMESGSPEGGALVHSNQQEEDNSSLDKGGHFSHRNFISCF